MLFTLSTPPALKSLRALSRAMSGTSFSVSSSLVLTLRPPDGQSWPSDWYLVEKPRARFQREINAQEPTEREAKKKLRENKQWVCKHTYHSARHPSARFSLCARSHNLFEYHLNIWWIFQQKTIKLPFLAALCARKLRLSPDDTKGYLVGGKARLRHTKRKPEGWKPIFSPNEIPKQSLPNMTKKQDVH